MILSFLNQAYDFRLLLSDIMEKDPTISDVLKLLDPIFARKFADGKTQQMLFHEEMAWQTQFEYVKVFDESLSDDDPDNYYMEREWRCTHNIEFRLSDIKKIYLKAERENNKKLISKNIIFYKGKNKQKKQEIENERKVRMYEY